MTDLLLDENLDLQIIDNDVVTGESTEQHQELLCLCNKGDFKENPLSCVGIATWLKSNDVAGCLAEIKTQFEADGMTVLNINYDGQKITPNASY
jgi:hypothetical protein